MESIWKMTKSIPEFPSLDGDLSVDVLVIGGGIAGILCAHELAENGLDVVLVEAERLCGGATGNTTAKITIQHGLFAAKLLKKFGAERARLYIELQQNALNRYRELCGKIDCDFEEKDSYVYSLDDREKIESEVSALKKLGVKASVSETPELPFPVAGAAKVPNQAQFNPLKFLAHMTEGFKLYENTRVLELAPGRAVSEHGTIRSNKMVAATHFPFLNKHGSYFMKMYQERSYVLALKGAAQVDGMYIDEKDGGLSFRNAGELLLLGGRGGRTGRKNGGWQALEKDARALYPEAKEITRWATQDCMTLDGLPYIGLYSKRTPNFYVASGFNKWGMTSSMAAATLLCDMILSRDNRYASVVSPSRSMLQPQLFINGAETLIDMIRPTAPRCPHLGCALKWNPQEKSWDCSCHGSRFTESGRLLDGPANGDKKMR